MTSQHQDERRTGPQRFQQVGEPEARPVGAALGAAFLLLLLVVGVPAGLVALDALPVIPTSLPGRADLLATIGVEQLLAVLVWVVWIAWLQFTVCVLVELRSALSGVGLPARVPLAGPSQRLARTLVVTVLLLVTAAGQATAAVAPAVAGYESVASPVAVSAVEVPGPAASTPAPAADASVEAAAQVETTYWLGGMQLSPEEGAELEGRRVYVVQPPEGRYHDNLWDIAERTTGDGMRYREVFELNKGRDQPDGQELTLERLIQPNWLLIMPEDATGVDRVTAVVTPAPAPAVPVQAPAAPTPAGDVATAATGVAGAAAHEVTGSAAESTAPGLVGAGLLAAGLLVALERRRRRGRSGEPGAGAVELEVVLRVGADPQRALLLDRGLRRLAAELRSQRRSLPGVVVARVDDSGLELDLTPAAADAPRPWQTLDGGRRWRLAASDLDLGRIDAPAPFPGLVSLGRDDAGRDVLVDLEAAQGPVALVGDPTAAREVATALAAELATNRWSDALQVTGVGMPDGLRELPADRYTRAGTVTGVLDRLRAHRARATGDDVLTGRLRGDGTAVGVPEYVVLGEPPAPDAGRELAALSTTAQRTALGVVCVGDLPGARWRLEVAADGRLTARLLGVDVRANRLTAAHVDALGELLVEAPDPVRGVDERRAAAEHEGAVERPDVDPPDRTLSAADLQRAAVRVLVLGEPRVEARRPVDEARRPLLTELVTLLALHPEGVHGTVLAAALWPGGATPEVRERTITRAAAWLGEDAAGRPHLRRGDDGRLTLGPDVVVDWDVVRSLLARARGAADPAAERSLLGEALALAAAPVVAVRPPGRYGWLARVRAEHASRDLLVDAAHRLVVLHRDGDDPAAAQRVAWDAVQVSPTSELLWRDLLRAADATGGPDAVRDVVGVLVATLRAADVPVMSAATRALVEELVPDTGQTLRGSA
ncbi:hypothetical protein J1G42_02535 [Cellulomonas sp. zg-ZUI222]|uniref:Bacterial transcriptional activator domain-containing protein n=1 Tax=Cellulomonas wangleii TaxID=2816956 RepID=A0ABX8D546_9CELL|nr:MULTISPECIES: bacterial transcriptional activator domain-containing protein [Cellulomonas]MBO0898839.1 hypothetical protein [Cellulomonas sp. zg-ZUI22]MBO0919701.1 hypothetical protein [Cellulomonas wangleii]MBO0923872.1 hypothetical protein [Cellulomonas wangleii]MBO0924154.1 hypothetical protein [Cellulomonas wangleii]QVI62178.1 hypothetical protein KG103_17470 [Cellulomonas wangleii]